MRISDWSSDVCSSDLIEVLRCVEVVRPDHIVTVHRLCLLLIRCNSGLILFDSLAKDHRLASVDQHPLFGDPAHRAREHLCLDVAADTDQRLDRVAMIDALDRLFRSEEHTSELQSLMRISYAVFCLKKKKNNDKKRQENEHNKQ